MASRRRRGNPGRVPRPSRDASTVVGFAPRSPRGTSKEAAQGPYLIDSAGRSPVPSPRRRVAAPRLPSRGVPARSRVTVRRGGAPLLRSTTLASALQDSREALGSLQGELDALLASLRGADGAPPPSTAADRLRVATRVAAAAFASLDPFAGR
jgi:hypothetical protein